MYNCAECFYQHLPYYKIRPLYILLVYILYKLNLNIVFSTVVISSISYLLICILLFLFIRYYCKNTVYTFFISIILAISPYMLVAATEASPNLLSALILLTALYILMKGRVYLFLFLIFISVLARPDNLIILSFLLAGLILNKDELYRVNRISIILTFVLTIVIALIINNWAGTYGFSFLFEHTFGERIVAPAEYKSQFGLLFYLKSFFKWAILLKYSYFSIQLLLFTSTLFMRWISLKEIFKDFKLVILICVVLSIIVHYLIFPIMEDKYFIAQYLFIDVIFIKNLAGRFQLRS